MDGWEVAKPTGAILATVPGKQVGGWSIQVRRVPSRVVGAPGRVESAGSASITDQILKPHNEFFNLKIRYSQNHGLLGS